MKYSKNIYPIIFTLLLFQAYSSAQSFKNEQLRYPRVRKAFENNKTRLDSLFTAVDLSYPPEKIYVRIFKFERILELWAKSDPNSKYKLVRKFPMTAFSGRLGPKRAEGDLQIPEGFYHVNGFNPASNYHLSLRFDYPNKSDIIRKKAHGAGGDIFIHGSNVTIGCVPIGNPGIEQLYAIAVDARSNGQSKIPVHIFPFRMHSETADSALSVTDGKNEILIEFWKELIPVFNYFENHREIPEIDIKSDGCYKIKDDK